MDLPVSPRMQQVQQSLRRRPRQKRKYLGGWEPERILTAAKQVEKLQEQPGWESLQQLVGAQVDNLERKLIYTSKPLDHATYAQVTGQIRGLRALQTAADQLIAEAKKIDEENRKASERQKAEEA